ncbi:MAG: hypothetical protein N4A72_09950 [Bacteroidales bacterium]|jgi:hypothetical protein|nr:hypothetical protein [Bacteroidales bacterium]
MRRLKLSLKKEVISDLESRDITGGAVGPTRDTGCFASTYKSESPCCAVTQEHSCQPTCNTTDGAHTCPSNVPTCQSYKTDCTQ